MLPTPVRDASCELHSQRWQVTWGITRNCCTRQTRRACAGCRQGVPPPAPAMMMMMACPCASSLRSVRPGSTSCRLQPARSTNGMEKPSRLKLCGHHGARRRARAPVAGEGGGGHRLACRPPGGRERPALGGGVGHNAYRNRLDATQDEPTPHLRKEGTRICAAADGKRLMGKTRGAPEQHG